MAWLVLPVLPPPLRARTHTASGERVQDLIHAWLPFLSFSPSGFSSWLEEDDDPVVARVNRRMQHITGLSVKTAELLQVRLVPGTWDWVGVFLDTWAPKVPRARLREACPINCMTA